MGDLARTLLTDEIQTLHTARKSGVLAVIVPEFSKALFFRHGRIVFASSTVEKDKLGESLIRLGRISRADFAAAYQASQEGRERFGRALVGAGLLSAEDLGRAVAQQVQRIVLSLFPLTQGEITFTEEADPIPHDVAVDLSTFRLLFEGARIFPDTKRVEQRLGDPSRRLRVAMRPPFDYSQVGLSPAERTVLQCAADDLPLSEILAQPQPRALLAGAVYALLCGGILEELNRRSRDVAEEDAGGFQVAVASTPKSSPAVDIRERLLAVYEALPRSTHYAVLGIAPDTSQDAIDEAYRRLTAEQERTWKDMLGDVQMSSILSTMRLRQQEAYHALSHPGRRAAYDRTLSGIRVDPLRQRTASDYARAGQLVREAQDILDSGRTDAAVTRLLEAVDLDPEHREGRRLLALTLADHPSLARTAERHFLTALELDPDDVDLRYRLATYYRQTGLPARAFSQLQLVLAHSPGHEQATADLRELQGQAGR